MTAYPKFSAFAAAASLGLLSACGGDAAPEGEQTASSGEEPSVIAERQANYKAISDEFKAIRTELEGSEPDFAAIEASATDINDRAQQIGGFFPAGTSVDDGYDTEALAVIWEKPDEFERATQKLVDASAAMASAASSGDAAVVGGQVKELGASCKGCHDQFRLDTD